MSEIQIGFLHIEVQLRISSYNKIHIGMTSSCPVMTSSKNRYTGIVKYVRNELNMHVMHIVRLRIEFLIHTNYYQSRDQESKCVGGRKIEFWQTLKHI